MSRPRTARRASSRAAYPCPHCGKLLHGFKGVAAHIAQQHQPAPVEVPR